MSKVLTTVVNAAATWVTAGLFGGLAMLVVTPVAGAAIAGVVGAGVFLCVILS